MGNSEKPTHLSQTKSLSESEQTSYLVEQTNSRLTQRRDQAGTESFCCVKTKDLNLSVYIPKISRSTLLYTSTN